MIERFINPWFLAGLAGAAVPVIIHLLTRDRIRKVAFSTLRFFAQGARVTLRRKRWAELLVILLRIAVCILAALAFARPFFAGPDSGRLYPLARVILVDCSASLNRAGGAGALVAEAGRAAAECASGTAVGLLAFDQSVVQWVEPSDNPRPAADAAAALAPGEGGTDFIPALKQATEALHRLNAVKKEIVLISDLQKTGFESYKGDWKLDPGVTLKPIVLAAAPDQPDVGIVEAQVPGSLVLDNQRRAITVRLINRGSRDLPAIPLVLRAGDREVDRQVVKLAAGSTLPVRFWRVFDKAGDNPVEIRLLCDDVDPGDNRYYFNARVIPEIPVLLVGRSPGVSGSALHFLRAALNPGVGSPFSVKVKTLSEVREGDVAAASVLLVTDAATVPQAVAAAAGRLLERGGGVILMPGEGATPDTFWGTWSALAPCRLKRQVSRRGAEGTADGTITKLDYTHPVFEIFQRPHHGDFAALRFARYWDVGESQASRVLVRFDDGRPAVLERQVGKGACTIWLSPPDPGWNNLALRAIFLPWLHETVRQSAVRTEWPTGAVAGSMPSWPAGYSLKTTVAGNPASVPVLGTGFQTLTNAEGAALCIAVNRPAGESDGVTLKPQELKAALERPAGDGTVGDAGGSLPKGIREWWWWLALALAILLPLELWLANRTARH